MYYLYAPGPTKQSELRTGPTARRASRRQAEGRRHALHAHPPGSSCRSSRLALPEAALIVPNTVLLSTACGSGTTNGKIGKTPKIGQLPP
jgi:hypothetical protein